MGSGFYENNSEGKERLERAVKKSFLYESLQIYPANTMHDSVNSSANDVYAEIFGTVS